MTTEPSPRRPPRRLRAILDALGIALVFSLALVGTALVHLPSPVGRALLTDGINAALRDVFFGTVRVESVARVGVGSVHLSAISVIDEQGNRVLHLQNATAQVSLPSLLRTLLGPGAGDRFVQLPHIRAESAEVTLVTDPTHGGVTIARALTTRPTAVAEPASPGLRRNTVVHLPAVEVGRVAGRFRMAALEQLAPELIGLRGSVQVDETGVEVKVQRFGLTALGLPAPVKGTATVQVNAPSSVNVQFSGFVGESEMQATFAWREGTIETQVLAPRVNPDTVRQFWPPWPLSEPLALAAGATGTVDRLDFTAKLSATPPSTNSDAPASEVHLKGILLLDEDVRADFETEVNDLSLNLLGAAWPASAFDAELSTTLTYRAGAVTQHTTGSSAATTLAEVPVPQISLEVTTTTNRTDLAARIQEPGANGELAVAFLPSGNVDAILRVPVVYLDRQRRLPRGLRGKASVTAKGQLTNGRLHVDANATVSNFQTSSARIGSAQVSARTNWSLDPSSAQSPIQVSVVATEVVMDQLRFAHASGNATVTGNSVRAQLSLVDPDGRQIGAKGNYDLAAERLTGLRLTAQRGDLVGQASVPLLDLRGPIVEIDAFTVHRENCTASSCPKVEGRGRYSPAGLLANAEVENVALERLWPVLGVSIPVYGTVNGNLDVHLDNDRREANLALSARGLSVSGYPKSDLDVRAQLSGRQVDGQMAAKNDLGIVIAGRTGVVLDGEPLDKSSWERATGTLELTAQMASLEPVRLLVNSPLLESLDGTVRAKVAVQRLTPDGYPTASAELDARDVQLELDTGAETPLRVVKHRVYLNSTLDPARLTLYASGVIDDPTGTLLRFNGQLPLDASEGLTLSLHDAISINGTLEPRELASVPYFSSPLSGKLSGQVTLYGTLNAPEAKATFHLVDLTAAALDDQQRLSVQTNLHYALPRGEFTSEVLGVSGRQAVVLGRVDGNVNPYNPVFRGSARLALAQFPLAVITPLADLDVGGEVSGMVEFSDAARPYVDVQLEAEKLTSGGSALGASALEFRAEPGAIQGRFDIRQAELGADATSKGVVVSLDARSDPGLFPLPHNVAEVHAELQAQELNAAVFAPLLTGIVARLNGALDATVTFDGTRDGETKDWTTRASGVAHLRDGRAYVEGIGLEFQDVTLDVVATPFGRQTHLAFDRMQARARSEVVNFEGRGQLFLQGLDVVSGSANVFLRDVPITLQGLNLGKATGALSAQLEHRPEWDIPGPYFGKPYMMVNGTLGNWQLRASSSASRSLIDTSPNPEVTVVQGKKTAERRDVLPFRIVLDLGRDTQFSLADLDLPLSGETRIDYTDQAVISGTLNLKRGGRVPILGHVFEVQNGAVRLNPAQPSNPYIDIILAGQAKDGSTVNVTLTGTMQEPLVSPPLGQLNELLGGGAATAVSGGVQALGVNSLLGDNVQFRVGSDEDDQELARYSAAVQIRESLWFEVNYARTETNAFRTDNNNAVSGTLDYRFNDNWSLRTEAGTTGGSVDVVWQYRY